MISSWLNLRMWDHGYKGLTLGLEHQQMVVSEASLGTNPLLILRDSCINVEYRWFQGTST